MWGKQHPRYKTPDDTPSFRTPCGVFCCYPLVARSKARQECRLLHRSECCLFHRSSPEKGGSRKRRWTCYRTIALVPPRKRGEVDKNKQARWRVAFSLGP